jgi:hypothetical protein
MLSHSQSRRLAVPPSSGKAQLFVDVNYGGAVATLDEGSFNIGDGTGSVKDNTVSSLKVADGYQVTLYVDRDCQGASQTFTTDAPRLDGINDVASSVRVATVAGPASRVPPQPVPDSIVFVQPPPVI